MKKIIAALIFVFLVAWMTTITEAQQGEVTLEFTNAATARELAQNFSKALQAGDVAKMDALLHKDFMVYGLGSALDSMTKAQHKEYYVAIMNQYKHTMTNELYLPIKVTNNWNKGEWILSWGINTITDKSTDKTIKIPYHTASVIVDGKIARMNYWYDMMNVAVGQGYTIAPPSN
jgi:ketosteroid isomerase-like protein